MRVNQGSSKNRVHLHPSWLLRLHFILPHPLLHYVYHIACWMAMQLCRCLLSSWTCRKEISEKCTASEIHGSRKKLRERENRDNRMGHGGRSMYSEPRIVTKNCLIFKSQRLFAPRIPFFASVVLRENGNADWSIVPRGPPQKDSAVTRRIKWRKPCLATLVTQRNRTFEKPSARSANNTASWLLKLSSFVCCHFDRVRPTRASLFPSLGTSPSLRFPIFVPTWKKISVLCQIKFISNYFSIFGITNVRFFQKNPIFCEIVK